VPVRAVQSLELLESQCWGPESMRPQSQQMRDEGEAASSSA
jgi:hypothetical protein